MSVVKERRLKERKLREPTRIKKDIRGWIGWDYIKRFVDLAEYPVLIMALFLIGGRATEVLELERSKNLKIYLVYINQLRNCYKTVRFCNIEIMRFYGNILILT